MNKVVIITGASRGLGAALAREFGRKGYRVMVNYLMSGDEAAGVVREIEDAGGSAVAWRADIADPAGAREMMKAAHARWGRLNVLVNNAGIPHESLLGNTGDAEWDRVIRTNLTGVAVCSREALPYLFHAKPGHIINISSILGIYGTYGGCAYAASKAGVIGFTLALAREVGDRGVCVNAVLPGFMPTRMTASLPEIVRKRVRNEHVLGRISSPASAARVIVGLAGMQSVSGQVFNIDGRIHRWT